MNEELAYDDLEMVGIWSSSDTVPSSMVIRGSAGTYVTMLRKVLPVKPGDVLDINGWFKVTNDVGYNVGVGAHLWWYEYDNGLNSAGPWYRTDPEHGSVGSNVTPSMHHLTTHIHGMWEVPADWPADPETGIHHRIAIALRGDAHSTAWDGDGDGVAEDSLSVDQVGRLTVRRYRPRA